MNGALPNVCLIWVTTCTSCLSQGVLDSHKILAITWVVTGRPIPERVYWLRIPAIGNTFIVHNLAAGDGRSLVDRTLQASQIRVGPHTTTQTYVLHRHLVDPSEVLSQRHRRV